jgi:hypothetical protein
MAGRAPAYHSLGFDAPLYRTDDVILRQIESTRSLGPNAHSSDAARVRFVLLRSGPPARGEKEKLPRPPTLVNQVTKRSQEAACRLQRSHAELSKRPSVERRLHTCYFLYQPCPGGGMADAEDLKSSGVLPHGGSSPPPGTISSPIFSSEVFGCRDYFRRPVSLEYIREILG